MKLKQARVKMNALFEALWTALGLFGTYRAAKVVESQVNQDRQADIMARTIWGEARNQGIAGMQAVASVIMNRVKRGGWYGATPAEVCQKPYQFSCWLKSDPNYEKLQNVTTADRQFAQAYDIAVKAINGTLADNTGGATEYHTKSIKPNWNYDKLVKTAAIGDHIFYRSIA